MLREFYVTLVKCVQQQINMLKIGTKCDIFGGGIVAHFEKWRRILELLVFEANDPFNSNFPYRNFLLGF